VDFSIHILTRRVECGIDIILSLNIQQERILSLMVVEERKSFRKKYLLKCCDSYFHFSTDLFNFSSSYMNNVDIVFLKLCITLL
jgi:hypothetical protein